MAFKSLNAGSQTLVECLNNIPKEKEKSLSSFQTLGKIHKLLFTEFPTEIETEECAKAVRGEMPLG